MAEATIVLGVDFSDCSANAADHALEMARLLDAKIVVAHAFVHVRPGGSALGSSVPPIELVEAELDINAAIKLTGDWAERLRAEGAEVEVVAEAGKPHEIIIEAARKSGARMIVVGSHGRGPIKRFFLGSTATRVSQDADLPVLVVPLTPAQEELAAG